MDDDTKLRREIRAALAMHALLVQNDVELLDREDRRARIASMSKVAVEVADSIIAELGPLA